MIAKDFMFRVTNTKTGESVTISLADLQGYEGEDCGVFINGEDTPFGKIPNSLKWAKVSNKSGCDDSEIDWNLLSFEHVFPCTLRC